MLSVAVVADDHPWIDPNLPADSRPPLAEGNVLASGAGAPEVAEIHAVGSVAKYWGIVLPHPFDDVAPNQLEAARRILGAIEQDRRSVVEGKTEELESYG